MTDFLQLRNLKTVSVASDEKCYVVKAEGVASWVTCPSCELGRLHSHGMQKQSFKDIPSHGKSVEIHILRRRYRCIRCGKTMFEPIDDLDGKRHATVRLVKYICEQSFSKTFAALAREVALDEKTIRNIFDDFVKELDAAIRFRTPRVLGIDEVKIIGHYRAILTNIEKNTLFDIRPSRAKADLLPYFQSLRDKERIKWVTMDMYHVYKQIVRATLPQAQIVVDRFHIQRMANDALDNLRKGVRKLLSSHQRLKLKDERFLLLKHRHTLSDEEIERVSSWFDQFPLLGEAHALKEDFFAIWAHNSRADAEAACVMTH